VLRRCPVPVIVVDPEVSPETVAPKSGDAVIAELVIAELR
jgi:hypothetical protein